MTTLLQQLTVLYVEDDPVIRQEIAHFLERRVGRLLLAGDGQEGVECFASEAIDLVVTDIQMPRLNGIGMTRELKASHPELPVIVTTAFNDPDMLIQAIDAGVDGYVLKPVDLAKFQIALHKAADDIARRREISESRAQLAAYHQHAEEERQLVAMLMERMMRAERLSDPQLHYWLQPTEVVGGDLIGACRSPHDHLYFMLTDSTGHGLPAAMNLLPINHIFYSMVSKNLPVALIVEEMNWAVRQQSPADRYVAAIIGRIDSRNRLMEVWNGGMPEGLLLDDAGNVLHRFASTTLPLGILHETFDPATEIYQWQQPCQLALYSDGLSDAENLAGEAFGSQGIETALRGAPAPAARLHALQEAVRQHTQGRHVFDDLTLMLLHGQPPQGDSE